MARKCELTGKTSQRAANRSHAKNKTLRRQHVNLQKKKFFIPELGKSLSLLLSTSAIRTITKHGGITQAILKAKDEDLSTELLKVKQELKKTPIAATNETATEEKVAA